MTVRELVEALGACDPDDQVHVCLDLGEQDSCSFHAIREVNADGAEPELVVYEAYDLFDTPPELAAVLLGKPAVVG